MHGPEYTEILLSHEVAQRLAVMVCPVPVIVYHTAGCACTMPQVVVPSNVPVVVAPTVVPAVVDPQVTAVALHTRSFAGIVSTLNALDVAGVRPGLVNVHVALADAAVLV